jgi:hypothetical protein
MSLLNPQQFDGSTCDENPEDFHFQVDSEQQTPDDSCLNEALQHQVKQLLESITRIGGEVCRLRVEMDELLEQNGSLVDSFQKLKDVISEKGHLDLDDFELACDVLGSTTDPLKIHPIKKLAN